MSRIFALALVTMLAVPAAAQTPGFVQVDGRAMLPIGEWADNFSFPDESQFGAGPAGRVSFGMAPKNSRFFTVGLEAGYTHVGTSAWEEFTASRSSRVDASARMWSLMAGGTVSLPGRGRSTFGAELHGALGVLVPSGEERFQGRSYEYDFLQTTIAGRLGARGVWKLGEFDLWLGADFLVAPGAVRHTEPLASANAPLARSLERRTLTALEPGAGLRYWFSL
ncbi:hypothetical protein [Vulgatibacter sp.]|uniref:hypothetical protein n=1 Tax=Vulgatibacter sp. TaxID=1971226 RepID=UPI003565B479